MATAATTTSSQGVAVKRSVARVVILSIITFGLYGLYWFFVTRKQMSAELGTEDNAGWQAVGMIVPILNIFILFWLWRDIDKAQKKVGLEGFSAGGFLGVVIAAALLGWVPFLGWALSIGALVVYCMVIAKVNEYWDKKTAGKATEAKVAGGEVVVLVIGVALTALWVFLLVTGAIFTSNLEKELKNSPYYEPSSSNNSSTFRNLDRPSR